jgi:single-strand DNA-binding protein
MARGVNKVILLGRLGKDPEMRYAPSGTAIATFSLATNHRQKSPEGEWVDKTEWHNLITFGKTAEIAGEYLKKGKELYIEGRLQTSSWEDQQGVKKYKTEIVVSDLQMIGAKGEESHSSPSQAPQKQNTQPKSSPPPEPAAEEEDDLPF